MDREHIIKKFQEKDTLDHSNRLFETTLEKGLFHRIKDEPYVIPIPSMHHLVDVWRLATKKGKNEKENTKSISLHPNLIQIKIKM